MTTDEAGGQAAQIAPKRSLGRILLSVPEVGVLGAVIVAFVVFYIADKSIADPKALQIMAQQGTFIGLAAFGMIFLGRGGHRPSAASAARKMRNQNPAATRCPPYCANTNVNTRSARTATSGCV